MRTKTKMEVLLAVLFAFAVVIIAPLILKHLSGDTAKMAIKPFFYVLLLAIPFVSSRLMKTPVGTLGFQKEHLAKQVLTGLAVFIALEVAFTIIVLALGDSKAILLPAKENSLSAIIYNIMFAIFIVGFSEETLFRGYLLERLRTLTSGARAVWISALVFGVWHFPNGQDYLQVVIVALLGALFGYARLKFKNCSTLSVSIVHGFHDAYIVLLSCFLL